MAEEPYRGKLPGEENDHHQEGKKLEPKYPRKYARTVSVVAISVFVIVLIVIMLTSGFF